MKAPTRENLYVTKRPKAKAAVDHPRLQCQLSFWIAAIILPLLPISGFAETAAQAWVQRYNDVRPGSSDWGAEVVTDANGNVIVAGGTDNFGSTGSDMLIIKYSNGGAVLWTNKFKAPGSNYDFASALAVDSRGNIFVAGSSARSANDYDWATIKYSESGAPLWTNFYTRPGNIMDSPSALAVDGSGNVLITGTSAYGYLTIKYSGDGAALWTNRYNARGPLEGGVTDMAVDGGGNVFVTGYSSSESEYENAMIKYSGAGVALWTNRYNGNFRGAVADLAVDGSGNILVTGFSNRGSLGGSTTIKYSGDGIPLWTNLYNVPGYINSTTALAVDGNGNVVVTSSIYFGIVGGSDYATIMYSEAGVALWTNHYDGNFGDTTTGLILDGNGNIFVTGSSYSSGSDSEYATIKYSGSGLPLWTNRYGTGSITGTTALAADGSGNVFVMGNSYNRGLDSEFATIKYSGAGLPLWTNRYDGLANSDDRAAAIALDSSDNVFVTGSSSDSGGDSDYTTIKYSGTGLPLWTNRYSGPVNGVESATALAVDANGDVIVTGSSYNTTGSDSDYATIKYSGTGLPLWTNRYSGPVKGVDSVTALAVDANGDVIVTGYSYTNSYNIVGGDSDYVTIKYSGAGLPLWTNRYNGPANGGEYATALAVDGNGNVFVTGFSSSGGGPDYATIKYSGAGLALWTNRYDGPANDSEYATALAVDGNGNVFVTGSSFGIAGNRDYATIKYSGAGIPFWTNRYDAGGEATALAVDGNGDAIVTGLSYNSGGNTYYATIKYSEAGVPLWTNRYATGRVEALAVDSSGNVFVTGESDFDYATIKYSAAGVPLWTNRYETTTFGSGTGIAIGADGAVYVTGSSGRDYTTLKYVTLPQLVIQPLTASSSNADLILSGTPNSTWSIERATLVNGPWTDLGPVTIPAGGSVPFQDSNRPYPDALYRTRQP